MTPVDSASLSKPSIEKELNDTKELINNLKTMGADVEAAEIIVRQAEKAFENDNLEMTKALLESTIKTFTLLKQQYFIQSASILFSSLQRSIVSLEGAGSEVNYIKDLYNRAKEKFDSGQYDEAMDYMKSAEDMVNDLKANLPEESKPIEAEPELPEDVEPKEQISFDYDRSQEIMEKVSQVLIRVDQLLQEAIEGGYAVNEAEKLYSLAEDAFDYQDYKKAEEYAMQSERSLEDILEPMRAEKLKAAEPAEEEEPAEPKMKMREDLPMGNEFKTKADNFSDMMPKGIIGDAPGADTGAEAPSPVEEAENGEIAVEKEATNLLISADELISDAKASGLNLPMAERLLSISESYFDRGDFETVKEYAEKAIKQIEDMMERRGITGEEGKPRSKKKSKSEEIESEIEPDSRAEMEAEAITETEVHGEPESEDAKDVEPEVEEEKPKSKAIAKLEAALNKIKAELEEAKDMGLELVDAENTLNHAYDEFNQNHFSNAKKLATNARTNMRKLKKKFIKKKALEMVKYAWKEIEKAGEEGEDMAVASTLLQDARNLIKDGKYEKAVELAMKSIQTIKEE
jgi:tetratricopeptide (TPR) repeat protein